MQKILSFISLISILTVVACASKLTIAPEKATVKADGIATLTAISIKDGSSKFGILVKVENNFKYPIIVASPTITCGKGESKGKVVVLKSENNNGTKETAWAIPEASEIYVAVICKVPTTKVSGPYYLRIGKIFDNPKGDLLTTGDALTSNLNFSYENSSK